MTTTTTTATPVDFAVIADAFKGDANRATIIRGTVAMHRNGMTSDAMYAKVNAAYRKVAHGADLKGSSFDNGVIKQRVAGFELVERIGALTTHDTLIADAVTLTSKGLAEFVAQVEDAMSTVKSTDPAVRTARASTLVAKATKAANEERRRRAAEKAAEKAAKVENEQESTDVNDGKADAKESLATVIIRNIGALDVTGITDDEAEALIQAAEGLIARIINKR